LFGNTAQMNAPLHPDLHASVTGPVTVVDRSHALIGQLIVRSAKFEAALTRLMRVVDGEANPKLLPSQKIRAIRDCMAKQDHQNLPGRKRGRVTMILLEAERLLALRAECAHSAVASALIDGKHHILLRNAQLACDPLDRCVLVTETQLIDAARRIAELANQLNQIINLTLPPQPKPDATVDP